eukprot:10182329-Alexandrium_andersonii.AAC.1
MNALLLALGAVGVELGLPIPLDSVPDVLREGLCAVDAEPSVDVAGSAASVARSLVLDVVEARRINEGRLLVGRAGHRRLAVIAQYPVRGKVDLCQEVVVGQRRLIFMARSGSRASPARGRFSIALRLVWSSNTC